jgi:molecular chaperone DnaK (HSP70)
MNRVYGIDLGTTYSCIAYVDEAGKPVIVNNNEGSQTTPSVVHFESESSIVVGQAAKEVAMVYPDQVVSLVKRYMGDENWTHAALGKDWKPQEISALILRKVVADAENQLGGDPIKDVVITCPAYFGARERLATKQAGEIAGLNVRYVIPEPTAAALAYGMQQEREQTVLVYDLGGGTFDVTLVKIDGHTIEVLATGGDDKLGGKDWDADIANYLMAEFARQTGLDPTLVSSSAESEQDFMKGAEDMKVGLSAAATRRKAFSSHGQSKPIELSRAKFDELTAARLNQTLDLTREMIDRAKQKGVAKIDLILMVGGSTYMPQVAESLRPLNIEIKSFQPNLAVAMGAAIFGAKFDIDSSGDGVSGFPEPGGGGAGGAGPRQDRPNYSLKARQALGDVEIKNVTAKGFGLKVFNEGSDTPVVVNILWKDDAVPTSKKEQYGTHSNGQREVALEIFENSHLRESGLTEFDLSNGVTLIGEAKLTLPRPVPANSPIEVELRLGPDGMLAVHGRDLTTGAVIDAEFKTESVMTKEEVQQATTFIKRINIS